VDNLWITSGKYFPVDKSGTYPQVVNIVIHINLSVKRVGGLGLA